MKKALFLLLVWGGVACGTPGPAPSAASGDEAAAVDSAYLQYETMIRDFLAGKRIASLAEVMAPDKVPQGNSVLLVYHGMDCGSCMDEGFKTLVRLKKTGVGCVVVAVDANISEAQQRYGYYDYIYSDREDRLRRELKYVNTPILLLLDDSLRIVDICKPAAGQAAAVSVGM